MANNSTFTTAPHYMNNSLPNTLDKKKAPGTQYSTLFAEVTTENFASLPRRSSITTATESLSQGMIGEKEDHHQLNITTMQDKLNQVKNNLCEHNKFVKNAKSSTAEIITKFADNIINANTKNEKNNTIYKIANSDLRQNLMNAIKGNDVITEGLIGKKGHEIEKQIKALLEKLLEIIDTHYQNTSNMEEKNSTIKIVKKNLFDGLTNLIKERHQEDNAFNILLKNIDNISIAGDTDIKDLKIPQHIYDNVDGMIDACKYLEAQCEKKV